MDDKIKIKGLNPISQNDFKESAEFPITQDGETYKASISQVIQKVSDKQDDKFFKKTDKIPNDNLTFGEVKDVDKNVVSGGDVFDYIDNLKKGYIVPKYTITNNYINKNTEIGTKPVLINHSNWRITSKIEVTEKDVIYRKGTPILDTSAGAEVYFLDENENYLGIFNRNLEEYNIHPFDRPLNTKYILVTSTAAIELVVKIHNKIKSEAVENLEVIKDLNQLIIDIDGFNNFSDGALNNLGVYFPANGWKTTDFIQVYGGMKIVYSGFTASAGYPIYGYDIDGKMVTRLVSQGQHNKTTIEIPSNTNITHIRACSRASELDNYNLIYKSFNQNLINTNNKLKGYNNLFFAASKTWAIKDKDISFNINGVVNKHPKDYSRDTFFNIGFGNEDFLKLKPTSDVVIPVVQRQLNNELVKLCELNLKVKTSPIASPATKQIFMHLGDSTVDGTARSGIQGAIVNELSRMLTGVGTNILPEKSPNSLNLTNINFIGTRGDQPIKHEGIGGWSFHSYLTNSTSENKFYNPSTKLFDIDYYLTNNSFSEVLQDGSNFTILCQLGWNDVFNFNLERIEQNCITWLRLVKEKRSKTRVKLISMQLPPTDVYKNYNGNRHQSYMSTMQKVMDIANLYEKISKDSEFSGWVEHISYMSTFFPENSYPKQEIEVSYRNNVMINANTDDVHPNAIGYAQMADTLFLNIVYNYC